MPIELRAFNTPKLWDNSFF